MYSSTREATMKKKSLYVVIATVTFLIIFTTAAICNTCQPAATTEVSESDTEDTADSPVEEAGEISEQETEQTQEPQGQEESTTTPPEAANNPPEIAQIILPSTDMKVNKPYDIEVVATDADGDSLTYVWSVSDGTIDDPESNPMTWTTPSFDGIYEVTITVDDGRSGTDTDTESVIIYPLPPPIIHVELPIDHKGYEAKQGMRCNGVNCEIWVGDTANNKPIRCFISFNIENLIGTTVTNATLTLGDYTFWNDPSFVDGVFIDVVDWGDNELIEPNDYDLDGSLLAEHDIVSGGDTISISTNKLKDELQEAINNDRSDFQIRIIHRGFPTNNNNQHDAIRFKDYKVQLNVDFTGP